MRSGIHKSILEAVNVITCILLGVIMVFFCKYTMGSWGLRSLVIWAGLTLLLLFLVFLAVYCVSELFPDRRLIRFGRIFLFTEVLLVIIGIMAWAQLGMGRIGEASFVLKAESLLGALFAYRISRNISGRWCAPATLGILLLLPSEICLPAVSDDLLTARFFVLAGMFLFFESRRMARQMYDDKAILAVLVLSVFPLARAMTMNAAAISLPLILTYYICALQMGRNGVNPDSREMRVKSSLILLIGAYGLFFGELIFKAVSGSQTFAGLLQSRFGGSEASLRPGVNISMVWDSNFHAYTAMEPGQVFSDHMIYGFVIACALGGILLCARSLETAHFVPAAFIMVFILFNAVLGGDTADHVMAFPFLALLAGLVPERIYASVMAGKFKKKEEEKAAGEAVLEPITACGNGIRPDHVRYKQRFIEEEVDMSDRGSGTSGLAVMNSFPVIDDILEGKGEAPGLAVMNSFPVMNDIDGLYEDEMSASGRIDASVSEEVTEAVQETVEAAEVTEAVAEVVAESTGAEVESTETSVVSAEFAAESTGAEVMSPEPEVLTINDIVSGRASELSFTEEKETAPDDYPKDDGEVITLGDILGGAREESSINDGSDGSMLTAPIPLPGIKEKTVDDFDFDYDVDDDADFDY